MVDSLACPKSVLELIGRLITERRMCQDRGKLIGIPSSGCQDIRGNSSKVSYSDLLPRNWFFRNLRAVLIWVERVAVDFYGLISLI